MGPRRTRSAPTWLLLFLAACAASSPTLPRALTVQNGQRTRILLGDERTGRTLVLQNLSSGSRDEVYRDGAGDAMVKVVDDGELQRLLDVLAAQGMFSQAAAAAVPGARAVLAVEHERRRYVWSRPPVSSATIDQVRSFDEGRGYVMAVYNAATAYHTRRLEDGEMAGVRAAIDRARAQQQANDQGPPK